METIKLKDIKPAIYNPRILSEECKRELRKSIETLGCIKPIIVNKSNNIIVAGHQRTLTMIEMGMTTCMGFVIDGLREADELRFNQLHNKCEYEYNPNAPKVKITSQLSFGWCRVKNKDIKIQDRGKLAVLNANLCDLLIKYGEYGAPICDINGDVIISSAYAYATKLTGNDMYVYCIEENKKDALVHYFSQNYGDFSYDKLKKNTYIQGMAQMKRLRDGAKGKGASMKSTLYEFCVLPYLEKADKNISILDFGAGQKDYANKLQKMGYNIIAVDPYHFKKGTLTVDYRNNVKDYLSICEHIMKHGLFDVVICDSVLNSVDSQQAEDAVVYTCKALCRRGGVIFMSGRTMEDAIARENLKTTEKGVNSLVHFFDKNGFTALYRNGKWFYQHFHDERMRNEILRKLGKGYAKVFNNRKSNFVIKATKTEESEYETYINALQFEFSLILPNGKKYQLEQQIKNAYDNRKTDN